jgi:Ser/Thr protein kinase RdoA (MazF antagonist)
MVQPSIVYSLHQEPMSAVAQKPNLPDNEIRCWLQKNYSMDGLLEPLPGECDLNFKLSTKDGEAFVCKISSGSGNHEILVAQNEILTLLNPRDLATIPRVLTSIQGESIVPLKPKHTDAGLSYVGRLLTFVPGKPLAKCAPYSGPLIRNLGRTVGRINQALAGYDHPAFHSHFDWDLAQSIEVVERYRDLISDPQLRDNVDQIYRDFEKIVVPRFAELRKSVIHNDINDYNVLAEGDAVTGLIDFGDMVHSHTICDLAIAMAYAALESVDVSQAIREMTLGYTESMPIEEAELIVLFPMMRMRLAVSASIAAHQMRIRPDDPYLSISQEPIRKTLPTLLALDVNDVQQMLKKTLS